jgi:asparagine N-glycosylation enzyme membrane subunit Stt3
MHASHSRPTPARPAAGAAPEGGALAGRPRLRAALLLAAVLAVAGAARFATWSRTFTPDGVILAADGDTWYHALRAERIAADWPRVPWTDPGMNHPYGAEIPWPPLLDQAIASAAVATGGAAPDHVAAVAAVVPAVAGLLLVLATAAISAALLGGGSWLEAALLVALLPSAVRQSFVGRPDHHVLEALLSSLAYLAYVIGLRASRRPWGWTSLLAASLALSFWNWSGSALYLLVLSAHAALLHLVAPAGDAAPGRAARTLAWGALGAGLLLLGSIALWGPPGALRSARLTPITGLSVGVCLATAAAAALVAAVRAWRPSARPAVRAASLGAAALLPVVVLAAAPRELRSGVVHGLTALGASSAWYASIAEFWPLLFSGRQPWTRELLLAAIAFGLTPLLLVPAARLVATGWRDLPDRRPELLFLATWTAVTLLLALVRRRFEGYAAVPLAVCGGWALHAAGDALARRFPGRRWVPLAARLAGVLLAVAPGLPVVATASVHEPPDGAADKFPLLDWLSRVPPTPGREGVLATWSHGHEIQWIARKPVVSTPFGTDIDPRALADQAAFFLSRDPDRAEAILRQRRVGFVLVENPVREVATLHAFDPDGPAWAFEERGVSTGSRYAFHPEFFDLVPSRLFFFDGGTRDGIGPALGAYRLLAESQTPVAVLEHGAQRFKLFGVVPGATLRVGGASPGARISARVGVRTNVGRAFAWTTEAVADASGVARLRVPYATGWNGQVGASASQVTDGTRAASVAVPERLVTEGGEVYVELGR